MPQKIVGRLAFSVSQSPIQFHVVTLTSRKIIAKIAVDVRKFTLNKKDHNFLSTKNYSKIFSDSCMQ